jgi:hypothetical protein
VPTPAAVPNLCAKQSPAVSVPADVLTLQGQFPDLRSAQALSGGFANLTVSEYFRACISILRESIAKHFDFIIKKSIEAQDLIHDSESHSDISRASFEKSQGHRRHFRVLQ